MTCTRYTAADDGSTPVYGPCSICGVHFIGHPRESATCKVYQFSDDSGGPCLACGVAFADHPYSSGNMIANPGPWACEEFRPLGNTIICRQCGHQDFAHAVSPVPPDLTTDALLSLIRDLMIDADQAPVDRYVGDCHWCDSLNPPPDFRQVHETDCAWLRAKAALDKVGQ